MPLKKGYDALDAEIKSDEFPKSGSIYTQQCCIFLAGNYDICCLFLIIFNELKIVMSEVVAREFSSARTVKRACCKRA